MPEDQHDDDFALEAENNLDPPNEGCVCVTTANCLRTKLEGCIDDDTTPPTGIVEMLMCWRPLGTDAHYFIFWRRSATTTAELPWVLPRATVEIRGFPQQVPRLMALLR